MKSMICWISFIGLFVFSFAGNPTPPTLNGYDHFLNLQGTLINQITTDNETNYFAIYYSVRFPDIFFGVVCDSGLGWCGLGASYSGIMVGQNQSIPFQSDVMIGAVTSGGVLQIGDFVIRGRNSPSLCSSFPGVCLDTGSGCTNNVVAINGSIASNFYTVIEYKRPLAASDSCDVPIIPNADNFFIYAIGDSVGASFPNNVQAHSIHGPSNFIIHIQAPISTTMGVTTQGVATPTTGTAANTSGIRVTTGAAVGSTTGVAIASTTGVAIASTTGAAIASTTGSAVSITSGAPATVTTGQPQADTTVLPTTASPEDSNAAKIATSAVAILALALF